MWLHRHSFYEINLVTRGTGFHTINGMNIPLQSGEVFVLSPGIQHGYSNEENLDVLHILIQPEWLKRYEPELSAMPGFLLLFEIEPYLRQVYCGNLFLRLPPGQVQQIRDEMLALRDLDRERYETFRNVSVLKLVCDLCLQMEQQRRTNAASSAENYEIISAMEYMQTHLDEKVSVETLVSRTYLSRATFNRHFRKVAGVSPMQYLLKCRINAAENLLAEGVRNRTEIAQLCGFYDVSHMNKYLGHAESELDFSAHEPLESEQRKERPGL